jgi:hypothetical protein
MAQGDEVRKSFIADAATYCAGIVTALIGGSSAEALYSAITNKKPGRATVITKTEIDSTANIAQANRTNLIECGNSIHAVVDLQFTSNNNSASVCIAKFDNATPPLLMGISEVVTVTAQGVYRAGDSGKYVAPGIIFDLGGASGFRVLFPALTTAENVDVYASVL